MRSMKRRGRLSTPSRKDLRFLKPRCHERGHRAFGAQGVVLCGPTSFMLPIVPGGGASHQAPIPCVPSGLSQWSLPRMVPSGQRCF